jgi:hypothetical protein
MASKHAMLTWIRISGRSGIFSGGGYESQMLPVSNLLKIRLCSRPNTAIWDQVMLLTFVITEVDFDDKS